jgi:hypothetical protein
MILRVPPFASDTARWIRDAATTINQIATTNTGDQTIVLTGDVTGSGMGSFPATISANAVTFGKFVGATQASFVGATAAGNFGELTPTAATTQLNVFTPTAKGLAPLSGGGTANFLRSDGTWAIPSGTGGAGTVTSVSVMTANGVSGTVATASSTPAITLTLGAITPTSIAATGTVTGSNLSGTNTGDQTTVSGNAGTATKLATARSIAITGDVSWTVATFDGSANVTAAGTIGANAVTFGKFVAATQVAFVGATVAGNFGELTPTQATAQLNVFSATLKGLAPLSGGGTANFLRADGTWAAPPSGAGTVTSASVTSANGFAGTVATATTTPAITISTTVTGLLKGNGTALSAATAATDYVAPSAYASANGHTMSTARLLGRTTAATGAAEEISVAGGLTLTGGILTAPSSIPGNAGTATALATGRTLAVTGDLTWTSPSFNGSANVTAAGTLATVNANVGAFGSAIAVPVVTVNAKGLVTAVTTAALGTAAAASIGTSGATVPFNNGANIWAATQTLSPIIDYSTTTGVQQLAICESTRTSGYGFRLGFVASGGSYYANIDSVVAGAGGKLNINPSGGAVVIGGSLSVSGAFNPPKIALIPTTDYSTPTGVQQLVINESTNTAGYGLRIGFLANAGVYNGNIDSVAAGIGGTLNVNPSGGIALFGGAVVSKSATGGIGYSTGAGGVVTQATSKATGVTLNTVSGAITLNGAALALATAVSFTLTNSTIAATDVIIVSIKSGATLGAYHVEVDAVGAGTATISLRNLSAVSLSEAVVLNFAVIKAVAA